MAGSFRKTLEQPYLVTHIIYPAIMHHTSSFVVIIDLCNMGRKTKLLLVKLVHTLIWAVFVSIIAYVVWSGASGHISLYSWLAVAAVIGEGAVLLLFKGHCPLTVVARRYSASPKDNFDIFLPNWLARYNKLIFTTLFAIGLLLMIIKTI